MPLKRTLFQGLARCCACPCRGRRCTPSPRKMPCCRQGASCNRCVHTVRLREPRSEPALRDQRSAALRSPAPKPGAAPTQGNKDPAQPKRNKNKPFLGFYTRIDLLLDLVHAISLLIHFTHLLTHPSHYNFLSCSLYFCRFMLFKLLFYHLK